MDLIDRRSEKINKHNHLPLIMHQELQAEDKAMCSRCCHFHLVLSHPELISYHSYAVAWDADGEREGVESLDMPGLHPRQPCMLGLKRGPRLMPCVPAVKDGIIMITTYTFCP